MVAATLVRILAPSCESIEVAGSIRRRKPDVGDVELLCIPRLGDRDLDWLDYSLKDMLASHPRLLDLRLDKNGRTSYGPQNKYLVHHTGIPVDIFSTTPENWWVALVVRTGPAELNRAIAGKALRMGMQFHAYGRGFTSKIGDYEIVCKSEEDVFKAVELPYLPPHLR